MNVCTLSHCCEYCYSYTEKKHPKNNNGDRTLGSSFGKGGGDPLEYDTVQIHVCEVCRT